MNKQDVVYISGPMTGYPEYNYPAFIKAEEELRKMGYVNIINPAKIDHPNTEWGNCMRRAITELMKADAVISLPGWYQSRGANIEIKLAINLGMSVIDYETLVSS
jgi:hypothetical protein